jgi:hypothetical protein
MQLDIEKAWAHPVSYYREWNSHVKDHWLKKLIKLIIVEHFWNMKASLRKRSIITKSEINIKKHFFN